MRMLWIITLPSFQAKNQLLKLLHFGLKLLGSSLALANSASQPKAPAEQKSGVTVK